MVQEKLEYKRLDYWGNEDSLLEFFFSKFNNGQMCSDLVYDIERDKILHLSLDFQKLTNRHCEKNFSQCLLFIKSIIHPDDYSAFLVDLVEFLKLGRTELPLQTNEFVRSFLFRVKGMHDEWATIQLHALILPSNKLIGIVRRQAKILVDDAAVVSAREKEILGMIADGDSAKIIGDKLNISPNTVITHRNNLKKKFGAKNTAELIKEAIKSQVI